MSDHPQRGGTTIDRLSFLLPYGGLLILLGVTTTAARAQDCYDYRKTFGVAEPYAFSGVVGPLAADRDRAIVPAGTTLRFLDIAHPNGISELDTYELPESPVLLESADFLAAVTTATSLILLDWSDASAPVVIQTHPRPAGTVALARRGDHLLVSRGTAGVDLYACTRAGGLAYLGTADTPTYANDATVHDGWLVVADGNALLTMDITDPAAPLLVGAYDDYWVAIADRDVLRVDADGGHLVVAAVRWQGEQFGGPTKGLDLMEVSPTGQLTLIGDTYFGADWPAYAVVDDLLHVSAGGTYTLLNLATFPTPAATHETGFTTTTPLAAASNTVLHRLPNSTFNVYDVRYPFFVSPDPAWSGGAFHDIGGGRVSSGFMLKDKTWWSGMVFSYAAYLYDVREPSTPVEIGYFGTSGGPEDYASQSICDTDAARVLLSTDTSMGSSCKLYDRSTGATVATALPITALRFSTVPASTS